MKSYRQQGYRQRGVLFLLGLLLFTGVLAQTEPQSVVTSPQALVLNPAGGVGVTLTLDREAGERTFAAYNVGEALRITVTVEEAAYLYLFHLRSDGGIRLLAPNRLDGSESSLQLEPNETRTFPPPGAFYRFAVPGPEGLERIVALATREPISLEPLVTYGATASFAESLLLEAAFQTALVGALEPLAANAWGSDTAVLWVGEPPAESPFGTVNILSEPEGAQAFLDDAFIGTTPLSFPTLRGEYRLRLVRLGFAPYEANLSLLAPQVEVTAPLQAVAASPTTPSPAAPISLPPTDAATGGTLTIRGSVPGAEVLLNEVFFGVIPETGNLTLTDLPPGRHTVTISAPGFRSLVQPFEILPGDQLELSVSPVQANPPAGAPPLGANQGMVSFTSVPVGAQVTIAGRALGVTPTEGLVLETGTYTARFSLAGYGDFDVQFQVTPNTMQTVRVTFER